MDKSIKTGLAIMMLLCLLDMPYSYFTFVRFSAFVGFGLLALGANERNEKNWVITFIVLAIMFQPFIKISFGRSLWNIIDVIVAIGLIGSTQIKNKK